MASTAAIFLERIFARPPMRGGPAGLWHRGAVAAAVAFALIASAALWPGAPTCKGSADCPQGFADRSLPAGEIAPLIEPSAEFAGDDACEAADDGSLASVAAYDEVQSKNRLAARHAPPPRGSWRDLLPEKTGPPQV